jgi:CRP/FNR family transcriptional regulator, cyclic AMP receptor protein
VVSVETANYLALLQRAGEPQAYTAGETVFREGDEASCMYLVGSGAVEIQKDGRMLERIEPGGLFGEMALIEIESRSADAVMVEDGDLVPIDKRRFWFLVQETPYFAQAVMTVMAARLRRQTR